MIKLKNIYIAFKQIVIENGEFQAENGKLTGVVGKSGSGKSSLFNIISLLNDEITCDYELNGTDLRKASKDDIYILKQQEIAYLCQNCIFVQDFNSLKNLEMVSKLSGTNYSKNELLSILKSVDLVSKAKTYPSQLSGGEKQRLAIAMALAKDATLIICDEITSALDATNTQKILDILQVLAHEEDKIVLLSSHDKKVLDRCDDLYEIKDCHLNLIRSARHIPTNHGVHAKKKQIPFSFYLQMAIKRYLRKPFSFVCLLLGTVFTLSSLTFSILLFYQQKQMNKLSYQYAHLNEIVVTNEPFDIVKTGSYNVLNIPFSQEESAEICRLTENSRMYPLYCGQIYDEKKDRNQTQILKFYKDGKLYQTSELNRDSQNLLFGSGHAIVPYYPEQQMEKTLKRKNANSNGMYMNTYTLNSFGFDEIPDRVELEFSIPVAYKESTAFSYQMQGVLGSGRNIEDEPCISPVTERVFLSIDISGELEDCSDESIGLVSTEKLFIPFDVFNELQTKAIASHVFLKGEKPIAPSSYRVFLNESLECREIVETLKKQNKNIGIAHSNEIKINSEFRADMVEFYQLYYFSMISLFMISCGMLALYGLLEKTDGLYFLLHGISKKQQLKILGIEISVFSILMTAFAYPCVMYFVRNGIGWQMCKPQGKYYFPIHPGRAFLLTFILAIVLAIVTEWKKLGTKEGELMIEIKNIHIAFDEVLINDGSLKIMPGKLTAVCGMSGSGKTSLLYIAGLLRNDKKRTYLFNGYEMSHKESEEALYRKKYIGYVFQENSLLEHLNIYENISFYANMADITMTEKDAEALLESVHLDKDLHESITHLSGGERQRLAIACALCKKPQLIVLDEPTSALDHDNIETILEILREQASQGLMILVASHDQTVISACDIVYEIKNQQLLCNQDLKNNDKTVFLPQKKGLGLKFYLNYYKLYLKQHFSIQLSMFMMCGLSIAVFLAYQGIAEAMERKITMNQNLIGNTELMIQGENVNEELLEEIRQHPYCKDAHAFSQMQILEVNGKQMDGVAWSFSKEKGLNKASVKLPTLQQQGVYMTQEMAVALGVNQEYQGNISLKLKTTDETIIELKEIAVMGIINVEMDNPYTDATPSLYVSHELLNQTHHFNRILAYAIHYDNTSHLQNIILEMDDSLEVIVYSPYMRTDGQVVALESINTYCPFIMKVTFILMVTMMFLVYSKYVTSRKLEICLLKANGMNRLEVFILIILELCIQALLIASFAVFFVTLICKGMEMLLATMIPVAYLHTYLSSIIFSFVVMVVPSVIGLAFYQFYDPAVILRND